MRKKNLAKQIKDKVLSGQVKPIFSANEFDFLKPSSLNFIWKHSDKNLKLNGNQYYIWMARGKYKLKDTSP